MTITSATISGITSGLIACDAIMIGTGLPPNIGTMNPTDAVVYYQLARVYRMAGRDEDAQEALQKQKELLTRQN